MKLDRDFYRKQISSASKKFVSTAISFSFTKVVGPQIPIKVKNHVVSAFQEFDAHAKYFPAFPLRLVFLDVLGSYTLLSVQYEPNKIRNHASNPQ